MSEKFFKWFAAVDWGSEKHQVCVLDAEGGVMGEREFRHSSAGLTQLADWVQSITGPASTVAIAIEVPHRPVVDVLLDRGFCVYSINPKQFDRLRHRSSIAGAKDDRRDARAAADGLRTDRHLFRCRQIADPHILELREWSRSADELQQERVRLGNRLRIDAETVVHTLRQPAMGLGSCPDGAQHFVGRLTDLRRPAGQIMPLRAT
jgi:hypothetical protein